MTKWAGHPGRLAVGQCTEAEVLPVAADLEVTPGVRDEWLAAVATAILWRAYW